MTEYNKLIRGKVPEIIIAHGETPIVRTVTGEAHRIAVLDKIIEEVAEYRANPSDEEFADIIQAVQTLHLFTDSTPEEIEQIRKAKEEERGGFEGGVYLERTE